LKFDAVIKMVQDVLICFFTYLPYLPHSGHFTRYRNGTPPNKRGVMNEKNNTQEKTWYRFARNETAELRFHQRAYKMSKMHTKFKNDL